MSADRSDILKQFCDVTGAEESRSKFFLESSNWQLEVALSSFYEHGCNMDESGSETLENARPITIQSSSDTDSPPPSTGEVTKKKEKKKSTTRPGFATLSSLHQQESSSDEEEEVLNEVRVKNERLKREMDKLKSKNARLRHQLTELEAEDTGQAFYAGGSERSGQQILDPGKGRRDIVTEMFKSVRERGAVSFEDEPTSSRGQHGAFSGVGYRLGQTADDHETVTPPNARGGREEVRAVRLRLYREGFTVDDGAVRHYTDPANADFLTCIRRGEIPQELSETGAEVRVSLEDRRHEECPRRTCCTKAGAFTGKGQMLGSPTPATVGAVDPSPTPADTEANTRAAETAVPLDLQLPITNVQFRLADGTRLTARFNHNHTVGDLRTYITTAVPTSQLQNFVLMTTFPNAELTDPKLTLEEAKLLNSVIVQRVK